MALGIERWNQEYRLGLRVQAVTPAIKSDLARIEEQACGEVSVRMIGPLAKQQTWHQSRHRPLFSGISTGHLATSAGTIGWFVTSCQMPGHYLLSNNHVLANENRAQIGDGILQPALGDGGVAPEDSIARLSSFEPLLSSGNRVDAAIARLEGGVEADLAGIPEIGPVAGLRETSLTGDEIVLKVGRTTGLTRGRISAFEVDNLWVRYDMGVIGFDRQIEITPLGDAPFSRAGDSGSLIVDEQFRALGLLFSGNDADVTYANPLETVLQTLAVLI